MTGDLNFTGTRSIGTTTANPFRIKTNNVNRVTVNSDGDLGVGTTSPSDRLHIVGGNIRYGDGVFAFSHRASLVLPDGETTNVFDLWKGTGGRGLYLVSVCRTGGAVSNNAVGIVGSSTNTSSIFFAHIISNQFLIGVSNQFVTVTNNTGVNRSVRVTAIPLTIDG